MVCPIASPVEVCPGLACVTAYVGSFSFGSIFLGFLPPLGLILLVTPLLLPQCCDIFALCWIQTAREEL